MSKEFFDKYFDKNPQCNPNGNNFIGNYKTDCSTTAALNGTGCAYSNMADVKNSACTDNPGAKTEDHIRQLNQCKSEIYNGFVMNSINNLNEDQNLMFTAINSEQAKFDSVLNLMEKEILSELSLENIVSGSLFILGIIIIIYLLFSKIIVY
tara:strand:- start:2007 stop:2462 length:456 start_codon:yes stop_codon:yes gene_type:complete